MMTFDWEIAEEWERINIYRRQELSPDMNKIKKKIKEVNKYELLDKVFDTQVIHKYYWW